MKLANVLVDFDNIMRLRDIGRQPSQPDIDYRMDIFFKKLVYCLSEQIIGISELYVRLYSGWHDAFNEKYSDLYCMVSQYIRNCPRNVNGIRIRIKIATSLAVDSSALFLSTLRARKFGKTIKIAEPSGCIDKKNCSLSVVKNWFKRGCQNDRCSVKSSDVFCSSEQKTVDTMIVCDLLFFAMQNSGDWVVVASDDDDMMPGIVQSRLSSDKIMLLCSRAESFYSNLLDSFDILWHTPFQNMYLKRGVASCGR